MEYVLEMKNISKTFPGVVALDHVQLQVKPGEVHALMGENGAGKSTLMKILMGIYTKDSGGEILFDGKPYDAANPKEAMDTGIAMIHQELNPILDMTVYENIFVGRELRKNGLVDKKAEIEEAQKLIEECGLHVSPKETLRNLTVAQCQLIEIMEGYENILAKYPDIIQVVSPADCAWDTAQAQATVESWLSAYDLDAIVCENDGMAVGAGNAAGANSGIIISGVDGTPDGFEAIKDGRITGTVSQNGGAMAANGIEAAVTLLSGGTLESNVLVTDNTWIDASNVGDYE